MVDDAIGVAVDSSGNVYLSGIRNAIKWCVSNSQEYNISVITLSVGTNSTYSIGECPPWENDSFENATNSFFFSEK